MCQGCVIQSVPLVLVSSFHFLLNVCIIFFNFRMLSKSQRPSREITPTSGPEERNSCKSPKLFRLVSGQLSANDLREQLSFRMSSFVPSIEYGTTKEDFHVVRSHEDWKNVVKSFLEEEIKHFKIFSVDTKSTISFNRSKEIVKRFNQLTQIWTEVDKMKFLILGTGNLRTVVIELKAFEQEWPSQLLHWFYDREIIKIGSDLGSDLSLNYKGLVFRSWVDTRVAIQLFERKGWFDRHPNEKKKGRTEVASIFYTLFGWSFKPHGSAKGYLDHYGENPPEHVFGKNYPSVLKSIVLYKWLKSNSSFTAAYVRNDVITMLLLGYCAAIKYLENEGKDRKMSERHVFSKVWSVAKEVRLSDVERSFDDLVSIRDEAKMRARTEAERRMSDYWKDMRKSQEKRREKEKMKREGALKRRYNIKECSIRLEILNSITSSSSNTGDDTEIIDIHPTEDLIDDFQGDLISNKPPPKEPLVDSSKPSSSPQIVNVSPPSDPVPPKQIKCSNAPEPRPPTLMQSKARRRRSRDINLIDEDLKSLVRNGGHGFHQPDHQFENCCKQCGQFVHMLPGCPAMFDTEGNSLECLYPFCVNRPSHRTPVCPTLHHKCRFCGFRGHREKQCPKHTLRRFRIVFDRFQNIGFWTHLAGRNVGWGFFPVSSLIQGELLHLYSSECRFSGKRSVSKTVEIMYDRLVEFLSKSCVPESTKKEILADSQTRCFNTLKRCSEDAITDGEDRKTEAKLKEKATIANRKDVQEAKGDDELIREANQKHLKSIMEAELFFI